MPEARRAVRCLGWACSLGLAVLVAGPPVAVAEEGKPPQVPLDRLLKLPSGMPVQGATNERKGGASRQVWLERFRTARKDVADARAAVVASRAALNEIAAKSGGQWTMSAPGLGGAGSSSDPRGEPGSTEKPLDFALSQEIKRNREEVERAERRLQELEVEANLASVPESWRGTPSDAASADGRAQPTSGARQEREGW